MVDKRRGKDSKGAGSTKQKDKAKKTPSKPDGTQQLLTPKRDGPEGFPMDGFNMDSPFVDFCNGMLSPITPSKGKSSFNLGMGARSPLSGGNWTPDLMAIFNGKNGDFLSGLDGISGFLPNGTPLDKMVMDQKENIVHGGNAGKKKEDSKRKKSAKDSKGTKTAKEAASGKGRSSGKSQTPSAKGKGSSKASSKSQKAQNKLSPSGKESEAAKKKSFEDSARYTTPKQVKKSARGPSRMLDFGFSSLDQNNLDPNFFSPTNTMPSADMRRMSTSDLMPKTPSDPALDPPKTTSSKRRRSSCNSDKCNCKKSKCLKLYCECFAAGRFCKDCLCQNCGNMEWNKKVVEETRKAIMQRDPLAFQPKILKFADKLAPGADGEAPRHKKGCHCKRSHCLKKYCECFQAGIKCSDLCRCEDCHNRGTGEDGVKAASNETAAWTETKKGSRKGRPAVANAHKNETAKAAE